MKMRTSACLLPMIPLMLPLPVRAADWLGLDEHGSTRAGYRYDHDQSGDYSHRFYLSSERPSGFYVDADYSLSRLGVEAQTFDSRDLLLELGWPSGDDFTIGFNFQTQGSTGELEIDQVGLLLDWNAYPAFAGLQLTTGNVKIYARDNLPTVVDVPERVNSDIDSLGVTLGRWFDDFALSANWRYYDYARDLTALDQRPVLQALVQPAVLSQSGLLVAEYASLSLLLPLEQRDLAWHLQSSRSELDDSTTNALQFDWIEPIGEHSLFLSLARSDEEQDNWSFGVGMEWQL